MMKKTTTLGFALLMAILLAACAGAAEKTEPADQEAAASQPTPQPAAPSGRGIASAMVGGHEVSISYGRPQLQGRDMLGQLQAGQTWRFGMNEATVVKTGTDLKFGETTVPAGSYSLFLKKVDAQTWHLIFNQQTGQWGLDHDVSKDLYEVPMTVGHTDQPVETFTISLEGSDKGGRLVATWDTLSLTADFAAAGS